MARGNHPKDRHLRELDELATSHRYDEAIDLLERLARELRTKKRSS